MRHALRGALTIAWTTALEAVRNRVLLVSVAFAVALISLSIVAASVAIGERWRLIIDVGLAAMSGIGSVIAIVLAVASFAFELSRRTAYVVLVRPLPRWAFLLGKYLGVYMTMVVMVLLMALATQLSVLMHGDSVPPAFYASVWLALMELGLVTSIALLFSTLAIPILATIYTLGVFIAGNLANDLQAVAERADSVGIKAFVRVIYYVLPDLGELSLRSEAANALAVPSGMLVSATLYSLAYTSVALVIACQVFQNRKSL